MNADMGAALPGFAASCGGAHKRSGERRMAAHEADAPVNAPCFTDGARTHVDDAIDGMLMCNPQLVELEGRRDHGMRVIVRGDWNRETTDHVAIISGGGSGHEPAVSGAM